MKPVNAHQTFSFQAGFSLLEMIIVIVILSILSIQLINSNAVTRDYERQRENRALTLEAKKLLLGFAQTNGYLPCPDTNNDGWEDRSGNQCSATGGSLPHLMLGAPPDDAWNEKLLYQINANTDSADIDDNTSAASYFSAASAPLFTFSTPPSGVTAGAGNLVICSETEASSCNGATSNADLLERAAIAVIVSFGKNSPQTWSLRGTAGLSQLPAAEQENADEDAYMWQSSLNGADDALSWITGYEMKYAILKSERGLN